MTGVTDRELSEERGVEPRISYLVARLERAVRAGIAKRVAQHGLTTAQYTTLSVLGARGGLSNAQLARRVFITPQSMSEVLRALEAKGLVERRNRRGLGRTLPAELTRRGRTVLAACDRLVDELEEQMLRGVAASDRAALRVALVSAADGLRADSPDRYYQAS
jgi:DNA-binding MarR family transcriptional regulator